MPKKTKAEIAADLKREAKRISDRNYRFRKMPIEKQRVQIAKDVIDLLKAEKIVAQTGAYMELGEEFEEKYWVEGDYWEDDPQPVAGAEKVKIHKLIEAAPSCDVCGIGACFVAAVRRADKITVGEMSDANDDTAMRQYLEPWFDSEQLQLIETAFECRSHHYSGTDHNAARRAERLGDMYDDDGERLTAIMENIIENGGEFIP